MAQTTTGALKALIEPAGLGLSVHRDRVAPGEAKPYVTIQEQIAFVPDPGGPTFDRNTPPGFVEHVQIDLWQVWRKTAAGDNTKIEDRTLARRLVAAVQGKRLYVSPSSDGTINGARTWAVRVINMLRIVEEDNNTVHHAITVTIAQELY